MRPPLVNATLTAIKGGGAAEDYDTAAGADTNRWAGSADAYVDEQMLENVGPNGLDQVAATRLVVPFAQGELVQRGDTVVYTYDGQSFARTAKNLQQFKLFGTVSVWMFEA